MNARTDLIACVAGKEGFFSAMGREDSGPEVSRFYQRVNNWCAGREVALGEGVLKVLPTPLTSNQAAVTFSMNAPVMQGPAFVSEIVS